MNYVCSKDAHCETMSANVLKQGIQNSLDLGLSRRFKIASGFGTKQGIQDSWGLGLSRGFKIARV